MKILYSTPHYIAIHKPAGFHVHPPEYNPELVPRRLICLYKVRNQIGQKIYPVHRLDVSTSGVLLFALSSEAAAKICHLFAQNLISKTYHAVIRGFVADQGQIDIPLELDSTGELVPASTSYRTLHRLELPHSVHPKYPSSRYSFIEAKPHSGRFHQIRRHFNRISHPIIGDAQHGDSRHNRFFREQLGLRGLCLKAVEVSFTDPWTLEKVRIQSPPDLRWRKTSQLFTELSPQSAAPQ